MSAINANINKYNCKTLIKWIYWIYYNNILKQKTKILMINDE